MTIRKGLGKGMGCGYKNIIPKDPFVHQMSGKGMKQPQRLQYLDTIGRKKRASEMDALRFRGTETTGARCGGKKPLDWSNLKDIPDTELWKRYRNTERGLSTEGSPEYRKILAEIVRRKKMQGGGKDYDRAVYTDPGMDRRHTVKILGKKNGKIIISHPSGNGVLLVEPKSLMTPEESKSDMDTYISLMKSDESIKGVVQGKKLAPSDKDYLFLEKPVEGSIPEWKFANINMKTGTVTLGKGYSPYSGEEQEKVIKKFKPKNMQSYIQNLKDEGYAE